MKKNPTFLKPQDGLTETQRNRLGLEKVAPRKRLPNEATSIVICNASSKTPYRTGQGEAVQPIREGAMRALEIASRGVRT